MEQLTIEVPRGIPVFDGKWIKKATINQINGHDERAMLDMPQDIPLYQRVLSLLERIVRFDGIPRARTNEALRKISIGDRVTLLLYARKMILGEKIPCTITCTDCSKKMSLDLKVSEILQNRFKDQKEIYDLKVDDYQMKIRPLNALDQNTLIENSVTEDLLAEKLAKSCILDSVPKIPSVLTENMIDAIGMKMEEIDPLSDITLHVSCPECDHVFQTSFPAEEFIFKEFEVYSNQIVHEVHWLAFNYGWNEHDILSLPMTSRKKYVELINATLSGEGI